ncbi:DNA (cytosine-5)-methyltransferase 1 [Pseudomonas flavescens]|uniref:DNA (cytosine-5-)-methyltransferase n=1 Tax=Phytopseudomonas flavescens TaxID=29435 RepID=A0A1G7XSM8_9GAMM|nr:DNA cytosine methyltransferase [Pseudomonas flavescens]SDG87023.1 DNA (cytosine-5)-methyltransferase 1 [Pseudomonas flavescens]
MTSFKKPTPLEFRTQYGLAFDDMTSEINVDLFAGGGGASTGIEMGLGRPVHIAINHNPAAISMHEANHPGALHLQTDVWEVDPVEVLAGRQIGWFHASPDCTHHSQAAGGQPRSKEIRDLSWVVNKWAGIAKPRIISLENVKQIRQWGPLIAKRCKKTGRVVTLEQVKCPTTNKMVNRIAEPGERVPRHNQFLVPDPKHKGRTWHRFLASLQALGYVVEHQILKACDFGAPTSRERLFLVARRDGQPIVWPAPTHAAKPGKGQRPYRTAAECIDWSVPSKSIFGRKKELAEATKRRIAKGIHREVLGKKKPFIVPVTHQGADRLHSLDDPLRTITAANRGELAVCAPHIVPIANWSVGNVQAADQPLNTVTSWPRGGSFAMAGATLIQTGYGERPGQEPRVPGLDKPVGTVVAGGVKHALASAVLVGAGGPEYGGKPVGVDQPIGSLLAQNHRAMATAFLAQANGGYNTTHSKPATDPMTTVTNKGSQQQLVTANLVHLRGNCDSRDVQDPLHTISAGGQHHAAATAFLSRQFGHSIGQGLDEPAPTITAGGGGKSALVELQLSPDDEAGALRCAAFLIKYYGMGENVVGMGDTVSTITTKDRLALVTVWIGGDPFVIVDIHLRMLKPHELYAAQGFPPNYIITHGHDGREFTVSEQVHMCGNSVSPPPMAAIARANNPWGESQPRLVAA